MTMLKLGRQTQLVQLRSMATIKEKVGTSGVALEVKQSFAAGKPARVARPAS